MIDNRKERGDWQTPKAFAERCCQILKDEFNVAPNYILEPTCGIGNFIDAARATFPNARILGIDINPEYCEAARSRFSGDSLVAIEQGDYLDGDTGELSSALSSVLVLGNPPWVTNSTLSSLGSSNVPKKKNIKGLRGIDAMTGESNFDICEWIILKALKSIGKNDVLAMLCKTSVARNICIELAKGDALASCTMIEFDSKAVFGISAAACLLIIDFRSDRLEIKSCHIDNIDEISCLDFNGKILVSRLSEELSSLQGTCVMQWRQGVKHDCSKVMELTRKDGILCNKLLESVVLEDEFLYPFIKSSKSRHYVITTSDTCIPMTQRKIGEDTGHLEQDAPLLWAYLSDHSEYFSARKSSIYRNAPQYSMFGVGDYSFAPYKVAVSGFYKEPVFSIACGEKPIMFDDTCYFIPFDSLNDARVCMLLLNSQLVRRFFASIAFLDSKRPYTKKVLAQIDLRAALERIGLDGLNNTAKSIGVDFVVTESDFNRFMQLVSPSLF